MRISRAVSPKIEVRALRDDADGALDRDPIAGHVVQADPAFAARRLDARRQHADGGGLARAVRPEQAENLAERHLERQIGERDVAEDLPQPIRANPRLIR